MGPLEDRFMVRALGKTIPVKSIFSILSRYYLRFYVIDQPSVLAGISKKELGVEAGNLRAKNSEIISALDVLISGV